MSSANLLNTSTVNFLDLVGNGKTYKVPPYQRDYSWTQEQWEYLWLDIVELRGASTRRHYMGAVVARTVNDRQFHVIDGQQRLATLTMLGLAVISKLNAIADTGIAAKLETDAGHFCDLYTDPGSIEHVLPENPSEDWDEMFASRHWDEYVYRIGNLCLLESGLNRQASNDSFAFKSTVYATSSYLLSRRIPDQSPEEWPAEHLEERQRFLASRAAHVWRSDFDKDA